MTKTLQQFAAIAGMSLLVLFGGALSVSAQTTTTTTNPINAESTGLTEAARPAYGQVAPKPVAAIIGDVINIVVGLLGLLVFLYILWGGFVWMTAGVDTDKVQDAQKKIYQAVLGAMIILSAYAISTFIINQLGSAATAPGQIQSGPNPWGT